MRAFYRCSQYQVDSEVQGYGYVVIHKLKRDERDGEFEPCQNG